MNRISMIIYPFLPTALALCAACAMTASDAEHTAGEADGVSTHDDYLVFRDHAALDRTRALWARMSVDERAAWESRHPDFISMGHIETTVARDIEERSEALASAGPGVSRGTLLEDLLPSLALYRDAFVQDQDGAYELDIPIAYRDMLPFINERGLVRIGDEIYRYSRHDIKVIFDGDEDKLALLDRVQQSDGELAIRVHHVEERRIPLDIGAGGSVHGFWGPDDCIGYTDGGGQRVRGYVLHSISAYADPYNGVIMSNHAVDVMADNQIHSFFAWWLKPTGQLRFQGAVTVNNTVHNVAANTGGQVVSSISRRLYETGYISYTPVLTMYGNMTFWGRHGSTCSI